MTIEDAIKRAMEGGWKTPWLRVSDWVNVNQEKNIVCFYNEISKRKVHLKLQVILLNPQFWIALGKAMGWVEDRDIQQSYGSQWSWRWYWHRFIDHLASGNTIESFFATLT